ncbi:MAG: efflux RND transporter permease subunit [Chlamydiota bacterium]|nr:efflux RND transporter permease subunit [Chlamydiota bacterium]
MNLPEFSVRRPVTIMMFYVALVFLGIVGISRIPQELFPEITFPQLTVVTTYANAAPEEVETLITKIIEESISTVRNLKRVYSSSKEGISLVTAEFTWDTNMDFAALALREKIDLIKERLPRDSEEPIVKKLDPLATPMMLLSITGIQSPEELLKITRKFIKDKLEKIEGIASAGISGGRDREILVAVNKSDITGVNVDLLDVSKALKNSNLNYPAGTTKEKFYEYLIRTIGEFQSLDDIGNTVISVDDTKKNLPTQQLNAMERQEQEKGEYKRLVLLKDIATITDTFKEISSYSRFNGKENISIAVQKQPAANTILTAQKVYKQLEELKPSIPKGVDIEVIYDESIFISNSITGIRDDGLVGALLAFLVLFFFLKSLRPALIVTLTIPVTIMIALLAMYFGGISINMMSLMGLALSIGNIVDPGIVVLENIQRRRTSYGEDAVVSTVKGTNEVAAAIVGSVLTSVCVFLPMIFLTGVEGQLFKQLAFTVIACNLGSLLVALTLVPKLSAQGRRTVQVKETAFAKYSDKLQNSLNVFYGKLLPAFIRYKFITLPIIIFIFVLSCGLMGRLEQQLLPKVDQGQFIIETTLKTGTKLDITNKLVTQIENIIFLIPELKNVSVNVGSDKEKASEGVESLGSHQGRLVVNLIQERERPTNTIIQEIKEKISKIDIGTAEINYISKESLFGGALQGGAALVIELLGQDLTILDNLAMDLEKKLKDTTGIIDVRDSIPENAPETKLEINKDKAGLYDMNTNDIALTCQIAIKGIVATNLKEEGTEIPIRVRLNQKDTDSLSKIDELFMHSPQGMGIPIKEVATLSIGESPSEVKRLEQRRVIYIYANNSGRKLSEIEAELNQYLSTVQLPEDYTVKLGGESAERGEAFKALLFAIIMAISLVYMVMASQFESLIQPFIIMFSVPFSVIGVATALWLSNTAVSIVAMLGFITLGGIVVNNAIIMFEYINDMRSEGKSVFDSVVEAAKIRLRPILMTTITTILGLLPLAFGFGEGGELKQPLAIVVIGGLTVATLLTLLIIPSLYVMIEGTLERFRTKK